MQIITQFSFLLIIVLWINGCLYTSHHVNTGETKKPGESQFHIGYGYMRYFELSCAKYQSFGFHYEIYKNKDGSYVCQSQYNENDNKVAYAPELKSKTLPSASLDYRFGLRDNWGPFRGIDAGILFEVPTNPASLEFYVDWGFKPIHPFITFNSIRSGYIIGLWANNSYFGELAASKNFKKANVFLNYRFTYLASQPAHFEESGKNFRFPDTRKYIHQISLGTVFYLGKIIIVPDDIILLGTLTFPKFAPGDKILPTHSAGFFDPRLQILFGWDY